MIRLLWISLISLIFLACNQSQKDAKNDDLKRQFDNLKRISGDFITVDTAAVIKSRVQIYGVILDSMGQILNQRTKKHQKEQFDMIPVVIKGQVINNDVKDEWEKFIKVRKIIRINRSKGNQNPKQINTSTNN